MNPQSKRLAVVIAIILVLAAVGYIWQRTRPITETPLATPLTSEPAATTPPAEVVSNTTFDIISPSTQPAAVVSTAIPGSQGY